MKLADLPRVNFWPYDLFGYLLPGATFLTAVALGESDVSTILRSLWGHPTWPNFGLLVFLSYIAGTCISAISSWAIEQGLVAHTFRYPTSRMFPTVEERRPRLVLWLTQQWFYRPIRWFGHFVAPKYCLPFPEEFQRAVRREFQRHFKADFENAHTRFWMCWGYISLYHPAAYRRGSHFVELYGFSRNTCMSFVLIALLPILSIDNFPLTRWTFDTWQVPVEWFNWTGVSALISLFFFANYLKLFRRMDDELFHSFLVAANVPPDVVKLEE